MCSRRAIACGSSSPTATHPPPTAYSRIPIIRPRWAPTPSITTPGTLPASCCLSLDKEHPMRIPRRRFLQATAAATVTALPRIARAQAYPSRPITMIVPYAAGGPTDTVGRVVAERMRAELGQPIVLENVGGAGGSIGLGRVARAAPDGYTINVGNWSAHVINGAIYTLPYDLKSDFEPIALLAQAPQMVVAKKATPADDLKGFIAWLKANAGKTTAGTAGIGSPPHIGGVLFQSMTGAASTFVHYRGVSLATQDLVAGQIDM